MVELELKGWTESDHVPYLWLLGDLVTEYAMTKENLEILTQKQSVFTSIDGEHDMSVGVKWSVIGTRLVPFEERDGFSAWCRERGVDVEFSGKVEKHGRNWPSSVRMAVEYDNHWLCMSILKHG